MIKTYEVELHYREFDVDDRLVQRIASDIAEGDVECKFHPGLLLVIISMDIECVQIGSFLCYRKVHEILNRLHPYLGQPVRYTICQK